ncbi:MAG TPA: hypothetical protein VEQ61_07760 [Thermoleophilaceae bacterium]|nr:hypothetical protein [Thermoleophilaceae bacterium]
MALAAPAGAAAATLTPQPAKPCYRGAIPRVDPPGPAGAPAKDPNGESVRLVGSAFTPRVAAPGVLITRGGRQVGAVGTDARGNFAGDLELFKARGEGDRIYVATERANPASSAFARIRVSAVRVAVFGNRGAAGRTLPIRARGFTTGRTLHVHITRGRRVRTVRIGGLNGACHSLSTKRRLFSARTATGTYKLQFDTSRSYSRSTRVRVRYTVRIYRERRPRGATAAAAWHATP